MDIKKKQEEIEKYKRLYERAKKQLEECERKRRALQRELIRLIEK